MILEQADFDLPPNPRTDMAEMRVLAAQDVLQRLEVEYDATQSGYVNFKNGTVCEVCAVGGLLYALVQPQLLGERRRYEMVGVEPIAPGLTLASLFQEFAESRERPGLDFLNQVLTLAFPLEQLALIEAAFMQTFDGFYAGVDFKAKDGRTFTIRELWAEKTEEEVTELIGPQAAAFIGRVGAALDFRDDLRDEDDRLRAIMENIITNEGAFRP